MSRRRSVGGTSVAESRRTSVRSSRHSVSQKGAGDLQSRRGSQLDGGGDTDDSPATIALAIYKKHNGTLKENLLKIAAEKVKNTLKFTDAVKQQKAEHEREKERQQQQQRLANTRKAPACLEPIMKKVWEKERREGLSSDSKRQANQKFMNSLFLDKVDAEEMTAIMDSNSGIESNDTFEVESDIRYDDTRHGWIVRTNIIIKAQYDPPVPKILGGNAILNEQGKLVDSGTPAAVGTSGSTPDVGGGFRGGSTLANRRASEVKSGTRGTHVFEEHYESGDLDAVGPGRLLTTAGGTGTMTPSATTTADGAVLSGVAGFGSPATPTGRKKASVSGGGGGGAMLDKFQALVQETAQKQGGSPPGKLSIITSGIDAPAFGGLNSDGTVATTKSKFLSIADKHKQHEERKREAAQKHSDKALLAALSSKVKDKALAPFRAAGIAVAGEAAPDRSKLDHEKLLIPHVQKLDGTLVPLSPRTAETYFGYKARGLLYDRYHLLRDTTTQIAVDFNENEEDGNGMDDNNDDDSVGNGGLNTARTGKSTARRSEVMSSVRTEGADGTKEEGDDVYDERDPRNWMTSDVFSVNSLQRFDYPLGAQNFSTGSLQSLCPSSLPPLKNGAAASSGGTGGGGGGGALWQPLIPGGDSHEAEASQVSSIMTKLSGQYYAELQSLVSKEAAKRSIDREILSHNSFKIYQTRPYMSKGSDRSTCSASRHASLRVASRQEGQVSIRSSESLLSKSFPTPGAPPASPGPGTGSGPQDNIAYLRNKASVRLKQSSATATLSPLSTARSTSSNMSDHSFRRATVQQQKLHHKQRAAALLAASADRGSLSSIQSHQSHNDWEVDWEQPGSGGGGGNSSVATASMLTDVVPSSPRTVYLAGCIREGLQPMPNLVLRKKHVTTLSLAHYGIGDRMGRVLSECLKDLPMIEEVNLNDNNLTDESLKYLVDAIRDIPTLQKLDLSRNKIDGDCADSLAEFLALPDCPLKVLTLQSADVDDGEADRFIQCLLSNEKLIEIDLSNNLLGTAEIASQSDPDIVTGGESIADFIKSESCKLEVLKLSWNSIRLKSAVKLAKALALNNTLIHLDLCNNGMGSAAGEALGDAIMENRTLKTLLVSNNNFTSTAFFCMCVGVLENLAMTHVNLNENPIGEAGARMVMQISVPLGSRVQLSAANCNTIATDERCWYDPALPCREYELYLDKEFDRAVAFHLLHTVANHSTFVVDHASYENGPGGQKKLKFVQKIATDKENFFDEESKEVVRGLRLLQEAASNTHLGTTLFYEADADNSGRLDKDELQDVLHRIGFRIDSDRLMDILAVFDVDGAGTIDLSEFLSLLKSQHREATMRIKEMTEYPIMVIGNDPGAKKYVPPKEGILRMKVIDGFVRKKHYYTLTSLDQKYAYQMAKGIGDVLMMTEAVRNSKLRMNEAYVMYRTMYKEVGDKAEVLIKVLPQMMHPFEARQLVSKATNDDRVQLSRIKMAFGVAVRPMFGAFNGYYCLDLSKEIHRVCLTRLLEQSQTWNARRRANSIIRPGAVGDTSQHNNWTCFRNEVFNGMPFVLTPEKMTPIPDKGILEFDFSGGNRPVGGELRLTDRRLCKVLNNLCLLPVERTSEALFTLAQWQRKAREKSKDGQLYMPMYEFPVSKALEVGLAKDDFYANVTRRRELERKGAKREEIKVHFMGSKQDQEVLAEQMEDVDTAGDVDTADGDGDGDGDESAIGEGRGGGLGTFSVGEEDSVPTAVVDDDDESTSSDESGEPSRPGTAESVASILSAAEKTADTDDPSVGSAEDVQLQIRQQRIKELRHRMQQLLKAKRGVSVHAKAIRFCEVIEEQFQQLWLLSRHLALIVKLFIETFGNISRTPYFGSYCVELVVMMFPRVVDIHNFELVYSLLDARDCASIFCRLGYLNVFNPFKPEVTWELDLSRREERVVAKIIVYLSVEEPGLNLTYKRFQWKRDLDPIPGWDVTEPWMTEEGMAAHGFFGFTYYSGEGRNKFGCVPDLRLRKALTQLVLIDENEVIDEDEMLPDEMVVTGEEHATHYRHIWVDYLLATTDSKTRYA